MHHQVARAGPIGPVVFVLVYFVGTVLFVPGSVLTIGSGFAFAQACGQSAGVVLGSAVVLLGAVAGDTAAFLLGRYALRPLVAEKAAQYRILAAVDRALEKQVRCDCAGGCWVPRRAHALRRGLWACGVRGLWARWLLCCRDAAVRGLPAACRWHVTVAKR